jgi:hypothetical protein
MNPCKREWSEFGEAKRRRRSNEVRRSVSDMPKAFEL